MKSRRGSLPGATQSAVGVPYKKRGPQKGKPKKLPLTVQPELVRRMHEAHLRGKNLSQLEDLFGYTDSNIKKAFQRLGLEVNLVPQAGCFVKTMRRLEESELIALAEQQTRVCTPPVIKTEWREWPMEKRAWFIGLIRQRLSPAHGRPRMPFSANVEPFDYTTSNAREIIKEKNGGKSSHVAGCKIKLSSQGVIWNGVLWFWVEKTGYVEGTRWTPQRGRKMLKHALYETFFGEIPDDAVIRHADGNPNNFDPDNLILATRNDVARENQAAHHTRKSRERTRELLQFQQSSQKGTNDDLTQRILGTGLRRSGGRGRNSRTAA